MCIGERECVCEREVIGIWLDHRLSNIYIVYTFI